MAREGHLAGCKVVLYKDLVAQRGREGFDVSDAPPPVSDDFGFWDCAEDCPELQRAIDHGLDLMRDHDWDACNHVANS